MKGLEGKIVLLGDSGVGKSSVLLRFVTGDFKFGNEATLGAAFMSKTFDHKGEPIRFQIWDTAGQEKYHALTPMYYRDADAAILVYDITNKQSFEATKNWINELHSKGPADIILAIVGNKVDLVDLEKVNPKEAMELAKKQNAVFGQTSAKDDKGINELFGLIAERLEEKGERRKDTGQFSRSKLDTRRANSEKKSKCCV